MGVAGLTPGVCLISAASSLQLLWLAAPLAGFAFGCHWSLMPPLASELFGMRRFATLYCLLQFATTFGTYAFATRLVRACCISLQSPLPAHVLLWPTVVRDMLSAHFLIFWGQSHALPCCHLQSS